MKLKQKIMIVFICLAMVIVGCGFYVNDYYVADAKTITALKSDETISIQKLEDDTIVFHKDGNKKAMIFYPGGKVEYQAYAPLMHKFTEEGISCILVKMPFHLAVLDMDAAEGMQENLPDITEWYIGGHSLGGSMAASYVKKHQDTYKGLVLLAAYSTADLKETDLQVFSVYGSEDGILNMEKYEKYRDNLPENTHEYVIPGGNHAGFGAYGWEEGTGQKGDKIATISGEEQVEMTVEWILQRMNN